MYENLIAKNISHFSPQGVIIYGISCDYYNINKIKLDDIKMFYELLKSEEFPQDYNINKRTQSNSKFGKILNIQTSTNEKNKNFMLNNSFAQYNSPIKKNMEKEFNTTITMTQQSSTKKILSFFDQDKNSYKFLKNKNIKYSKKNKINKNIFDKLYSNKDERCDHEEKKKHKMLVYQSYSNSMKNLFVNLNDNYIKQLKK